MALSQLAGELVCSLGVLLGAGVLVACTYAFTWSRRPALRHVLTWPLVLAAMLRGDLASGHVLPDRRTSLRGRRPLQHSTPPQSSDEILRESSAALAADWVRVGDDLRVALSQVAGEFLDDRLDPTGQLRMRVSAALLAEGALPDPDGLAALAEAEPDLPRLVLDRSGEIQRERFRRDWAALGERSARRSRRQDR